VRSEPSADGETPGSPFERRLYRLRDELHDEGMPLPVDGPAGLRLLAEVTYARRPPHHERHVPGYGALVFPVRPDWTKSPQVPLVLPADRVDPAVLRRYADGRSTFIVVTSAGMAGLAAFEHDAGNELSAVHLQHTGAVVVQRTEPGVVRVCAPGGVVVWTGSRWLFRPLAEEYVRAVECLVPHSGRDVLAGLLELAVHTLAASRIGATLIWNLDGAPPIDRRSGMLELAGSLTGPPLSVTRRAHFPAVRSVLSQVDLATVIEADGTIGPIGVRLNHTIPSGDLVPAMGGARHTSAQRFTHEVPGVLAVVISESGRVTVYSRGVIAAEMMTRRPATHSAARTPPPTTPAMTGVRCASEQADAQGGSDQPARHAVEQVRPHR